MSFPAEGILQRAIAFFATLGLGVAAYIAIVESGGSAPVCLSGGSGCETVASSSYAHLAGVNIAVLGIIGYALLLASAFFVSDLVRFGGFLVALSGFGYNVFLTYVELFKIEATCEWCLASAALMTILFALSAARLVGYGGAPERAAEPRLSQGR